MKDARGHEYFDLLSIQQDHLLQWKLRLRESLFTEIESYVRGSNQEAREGQPNHRVYRGQDIIQIIMMWPNLGPCYVPVTEDVL